jgi:hypothetical protein
MPWRPKPAAPARCGLGLYPDLPGWLGGGSPRFGHGGDGRGRGGHGGGGGGGGGGRGKHGSIEYGGGGEILDLPKPHSVKDPDKPGASRTPPHRRPRYDKLATNCHPTCRGHRFPGCESGA